MGIAGPVVRCGRSWGAGAALLAATLMACGPSVAAAVAQSSAALYYETKTSAGSLAIDRMSPAGSRSSTEVVDVGPISVFGIAVDRRSLYWTYEVGPRDAGALMRSSLTGRRIRVLVAGLAAPASVIAVNGFVYWSDQNAIGRVAADGSHLRRRLIVLPREKAGGVADGLASDGTHIYFSRCLDHLIGRADLDGRHLMHRFLFTGQHSCPQGITVGARTLYWTELGSGTIGRADVDGSVPNGTWLNIHSDEGPFQIVADAEHVYWTWGGVAGSPSFTGRAGVDGSGLEPQFLPGSRYPMALSPAPEAAAQPLLPSIDGLLLSDFLAPGFAE
jgi:hypothetical protein